MIPTPELKQWLAGRGSESAIAIDDGGLTLVELEASTGKETGHYLEIGGVPENNAPGDGEESHASDCASRHAASECTCGLADRLAAEGVQ